MTTAKPSGPSSSGRIVVVGGYGAVGATVTSTLGEWFPGRVVPAGRDESKVRRLGGVRVDVSVPDGFRKVLDVLGDVALVVLCVEPPDTTIARFCLERGIHVVDVGATAEVLNAVADLTFLARHAGASALLSVGVAPGLTNLLARRADEAVGGAQRIDLTLLFGAGERHGADALRWTMAALARSVSARPSRIELPGYGVRTAYPFPFSDQYTLPRTLGVSQVTTRLCLESRPLTAALFALRRGVLARLAGRSGVQRVLADIVGRVHLSSDGFVVRADAWCGERHAAYALTGREQSRVTGLVAAYAAREVLAGGVAAGVHHIEQVPGLAALPEKLTGHGVTLLRHAGRVVRR